MIDLHNHTYFSDGRISPADLLRAAQEQGVKVLAITDHDNTNGWREAAPLASDFGVELIPGIEFTTRWDGVDMPPEDQSVDLLGLLIDPDEPRFAAFEQATLSDIYERIDECCRWLTARGYPVTLADCFAQNPRYAGLRQLYEAIIANGLVKNWKEAGELALPAWFAARLPRYTVQEAITRIHEAGGVAILAHPQAVNPGGKRLDRTRLAELVNAGLDGIEGYHQRQTREERAYFQSLAQEMGILVSGGTDFHGYFETVDSLGTQGVTEEMLAALRARAAEY